MKKIGTLFLLIVILVESVFTVKAFSNSTNIKYYVEPTLEYEDWYGEFHNGLLKVKKDNNWGCIDKLGNEVIPCIYDGLTFLTDDSEESNKYLVAQKDNKTFYIDNTGKEIMSFDNDMYSFRDYCENMILVEKDKKYGYLDMSGNEVIPCIYDTAYPFYDGLAIVEKNNEILVIDKNNTIVLTAFKHKDKDNYNSIKTNFIGNTEKYAISYFERNYGVINLEGKEIIPYGKYKDIRMIDFDSSQNKLYRISVANSVFPDNVYDGVSRTDSLGLIDKAGKEIIPLEYEEILGHSVSTKNHDDRYIVLKENKWGVYDDNGNLIIPVEYKNPFAGYAYYHDYPSFSGSGYITFNKDDKWGALDKDGNIVIPFEFDYQSSNDAYPVFSDEDTIVLMKDGKWGVLDNKGNVIVDFVFDGMGNFSEGVAVVELDDKLGVIANPLSNEK